MRVLKGILKESQEYYQQAAKEIRQRLAALPRGSIKKRKINNRVYYYLQFRKEKKVVHQYLGSKKPVALAKKLNEHRQLQAELKRVNSSLIMLKKVKGGKRKKKA